MASWHQDALALRAIRQAVFIFEQHVPASLEWDGLDEAAMHLLAQAPDGRPIGCARLLEYGSIGRMAVLPAWRKQGVGKALLQAALSHYLRQGRREVKLSAQTHAIGFYEQAGFEVCSEPYLDAGIPHRDMRLRLST